MTEPLSVTASIAGLLSLGIQVSEALCRFYTLYKGQDTEIFRTVDKLENLSVVFRSVETALQSRPDDGLTRAIHQSVDNCSDIITELQDEYKRFQSPCPSGIKGTIKVSSRRVSYPFRRSTLQKLDEDIQEIRDTLSVALEVLHLGEQKKLQDDIKDVKSILERIHGSQTSSIIREWLKAPDVTLNHNAACAKRCSGTGEWFIEGHEFKSWMTQNNSFLWLNGFAGCGKSVLCSTAIQQTYSQRLHHADIGIAFFYFAFNDESKQDGHGMLRALLLQLAGQHPECQTDLINLHRVHTPGTPAIKVLVEQLRQTVQRFQHVHIFLDALDECPRDGGRDQVLEIVRQMRVWQLPGLHLLITSRDELEIRKSLRPNQAENVVLSNRDIDRDISNFISYQLRTNQHLKKWQIYHDQIQQALSERAQGIFRYVECQIQDLRRCPRTKAHLERCLQSLPRNLDETYERMLCNINEDCLDDARRILSLLCFSSRPLTVKEVIDAYAVDLSEPCQLDREGRQLNEESLFEICPGLIEVVRTRIYGYDISERFVRIAHFSVQEYLVSERMLQQKAVKFSIKATEAHRDMTCICLIYLLDLDISFVNISEKEFPLAFYAAMFWSWHFRQSGKSRAMDLLVLKFFENFESLIAFFNTFDSDIIMATLMTIILARSITWILLHVPDKLVFFDPHLIACPSAALYYGCLLGLIEPVKHLLQIGIDVNSPGRRHGSALMAASWEGHEDIVKLLLEKGANINAQGGFYGTALQSACFWGYQSIVIRLLERGADVNRVCGYYGIALQAACLRGHKNIAEELLRRGADVNAQGGEYGTALQAACSEGHIDVVKLLLKSGASFSVQNGRFESALQAAIWKGHKDIAKLLYANGDALKGRPTSFMDLRHEHNFRIS